MERRPSRPAPTASPASPLSTVADVVGETIAALGVHDVFGVLGSGNLVVTNALTRRGAIFHATRHEAGAVSAADGYARVSGRVGIATVHQGPGLTNAMTGLAEAAKSRTPVLVLAGDTPAAALNSNFRIDQHGLVEAVGAIAERLHGPATAADDALRAYERALTERRPVVLMLPIDVQAQPALQVEPSRAGMAPLLGPAPRAPDVLLAADILGDAQLPAIIAGRGAVLADAGAALEELGQRVGAVLATSAMANGLFAELPFALGIAGGFATPLAQDVLPRADVVLLAGASANAWTTKHGALIGPEARVIQVDVEPRAIGRHRPVELGIVGDVAATAEAITAELARREHLAEGFRSPEMAHEIAHRRWEHEPYEDGGRERAGREPAGQAPAHPQKADTRATGRETEPSPPATPQGHIDPRTLTIALNRILPRHRAVVVDSGAFMGYPAMYLDVADPRAWVFVNGFQAVGLAIAAGIGASIAQPDRPTVVAVGDGGTFMALPELETAVRLKLLLLVVIYDDAAYGAEVHHFEPLGHDVSRVRFPDADLAAIARAAGAKAASIRAPEDLDVVREWLLNPHGPLVLDAKVDPAICADWLAEAFRQ